MEEVQTIIGCGAGTTTKRLFFKENRINCLQRILYLLKLLLWKSKNQIHINIVKSFLPGHDKFFLHLFHSMKTYFTSDEKISLAIEIAEREKKLLELIGCEQGYSLYVGILMLSGLPASTVNSRTVEKSKVSFNFLNRHSKSSAEREVGVPPPI